MTSTNPATAEASGLKATAPAPATTTSTTTTESGAAPTATEEAASESTVPAATPPATSSMATSTATYTATSMATATPTTEAGSEAVRPPVSSPATPARPSTATAVRSSPRPIVLDSPTPQQQMALQLLRSSLLEEPRRSRALAAVLALPDARHLEFRALDSSDPPNLARMQNLEAAVGFTVGELVQPPCTDCAAGYGQFAGCVRAEGLLHGSCTNCHFGGEGARCSLRASAVPLAPVTGSPSGRSERSTGGVGRGLKRPPPQLKDLRSFRRARTSSPARAAASRAPPTRRPDDPYYVRNEEDPTHTLHAWIERFRAASPASRRRLRLGHTLAGVAMDFVTSTEAAPRGTFYTEVVVGPRSEEEEDGEG